MNCVGVGLCKVFESGNGSVVVFFDDVIKFVNEIDIEDEWGGK